MTLVELTLFGIPLILISSAMLGFFTAYGVGANDVANAMGTSVGSKVLTVKQAVLVAAVFEFLGAFLAGGGVTQTIRKGVIDPTLFDGNLEIFIYGMISALFAAGTWLLISSLRGWPVSTTHTIVGAIHDDFLNGAVDVFSIVNEFDVNLSIHFWIWRLDLRGICTHH